MTSHTAYFDASGDKGSAMLTVGGYISLAESWSAFDTEWQAVLSKAKVPYFHRKKFTANRAPFSNKKWEREHTRKAFLNSLIGIIARNVDFCVLNILPIQDWVAVNREFFMEEERLSPFAVTGCMAITSTYEWCRTQGVPYNKVEFIFEDGDNDKGDFEYWSKKAFGMKPLFKGKSADRHDPHQRPVTPLQACDFIAGEARCAETALDNRENNAGPYEFRCCFEELLDRTKSHDKNEKWNKDNLRKLCEKQGIKKR